MLPSLRELAPRLGNQHMETRGLKDQLSGLHRPAPRADVCDCRAGHDHADAAGPEPDRLTHQVLKVACAGGRGAQQDRKADHADDPVPECGVGDVLGFQQVHQRRLVEMADASLGCGEAGECGSAALPERGEESGHPVGDVGGHPRGEGVDGVAGGNAFSRASGLGSLDDRVQELLGCLFVEGAAAAFENGAGHQMGDARRVVGRLECAERGGVEEQRGTAAGKRGKISLLPGGGQLTESEKHRPVGAGKAMEVVLEFALVRCGAQIDEPARCAGSAGPFENHVGDMGVVEELGFGDGGAGVHAAQVPGDDVFDPGEHHPVVGLVHGLGDRLFDDVHHEPSLRVSSAATMAAQSLSGRRVSCLSESTISHRRAATDWASSRSRSFRASSRSLVPKTRLLC